MSFIYRSIFLSLLLVLLVKTGNTQVNIHTPNVRSVLYVGTGKEQPLIVGLGGSEGGNAWASDYWKPTRDRFVAKGYAFLALGYFGAAGTPPLLDKIALEDVYQNIQEATKDTNVKKSGIALIGGSRGADLALLLGSYYPEISCVVGLVASHAVFPGHTDHFTSSCWTFKDKELPFVPVNEAAIPFLIKRDLRGAFETMLLDSVAATKAAIPVEKIKGPILLLSATEDEICPSTPMSEAMIQRLKDKQFRYAMEHHAINGSHAKPLQRFDLVEAFLAKHYGVK